MRRKKLFEVDIGAWNDRNAKMTVKLEDDEINRSDQDDFYAL